MHYLSRKEFSGIRSSVSDRHWVAPQSLGKLWVHISGTFGGFRCPPSTALQCYLRIQVLAWDLQYTFFWTLLQENGWRNLVWISSRDPKRKAPVDRFLVATFRCSITEWTLFSVILSGVKSDLRGFAHGSTERAVWRRCLPLLWTDSREEGAECVEGVHRHLYKAGKMPLHLSNIRSYPILPSAKKPLVLPASWERGHASSSPQLLDACMRTKG